jgi:DNA-binding Lrp family transcriptional regulator
MDLDHKDQKLLMLLQENSREQLKILANKIGLSIDSTKKRIQKLKEKGIIDRFSIFINPKAIHHDIVVDIKIKLHNITEEGKKLFINYLIAHPNCIELISVSGDFDFTCVLITKNTKELNNISYSIRQKFKDIISDWVTSFNLEVHKFEHYNFEGL